MLQIYMKGSGKLQYDSKTALRIPPRTVMAYSVIKMTVESDGYIGQWHLLNMAEQHYSSFICIFYYFIIIMLITLKNSLTNMLYMCTFRFVQWVGIRWHFPEYLSQFLRGGWSMASDAGRSPTYYSKKGCVFQFLRVQL